MNVKNVIIPFHEKDLPTLNFCCESIKQHFNEIKIFLIGLKDPKVENVIFINENDINNIISLKEIHSKWEKQNTKLSNRSGWIYQQLLKLGANDIIPNLSGNYLISDSDIIFLKNPYTDINDDVFPYSSAYTGEYHLPYIKTYERLMKYSPESKFSFINHHMIFNNEKIKELKKEIENKNQERWDLSIINCIDYNSFSDFSEYDLYGNWVYKNYQKSSQKIEIKIKDINKIPNQEEIFIAKTENFHILSCQEWRR